MLERSRVTMRDHEQLAMLVAEIAGFLATWQQRLSAGAAPDAAQARTQSSQVEQLRERAAQLGVGGLAHHLARCSRCLADAAVDPLALRESLRDISEITWQLRQELKSGPPPDARAPEIRLAQSLLAPPLLSSSIVEPSPAPPPQRSAASAVVPPNPSRASTGLLATLFGLRAFGQAPRARASPQARVDQARGSSLLGLRRGAPAQSPLARPPLISGRGGLSPLSSAVAESGAGALVDADLEARLRQIQPRSPAPSRGSRSRGGKRRSARARSASLDSVRRASRVSWGIVLLLTIPVGMLLGNAFLMVDRHLRARERRPEGAALALEAAPIKSVSPTAPASATPATQQLQELVVQIHGFGGEESPELAALLNAEANAAARALSERCEAAGSACESQRLARDLLTPRPLARRPPHRSVGPPPRWLAGLTIPAIGAQDHPEVQRWLEYYTSHSVGRELFQTMLFRCGAEQDLINATLVHHGLPLDLLAVVFTESACVLSAESAVGARGLWQFMASTARAYHLHVQEGVVDERLSPVKSTEAAVRYLADLYRKMGSWEMAFASYDAGSGPFRMLARLRQAGTSATFWDLADARLIPEETARYVPRIQAYAVILANLRHFDFSTAQMHTAEQTADLEVPSRARLGQVARAAGTSVAYLRSLNPDLVGTVIPDLPNDRFVLQVPKATVFRARETLGQYLREQLDLCVSSAFDWGRERFTAEIQAQCAARRSR